MRVVADAGPLISLSNTCMLWVLRKLPFEIFLPPWVVNEVSRFPRSTKQYKLSALRINEYIAAGILREAELGRTGENIARRVQQLANSAYTVHHRPLRIIQRGEAEAVALATLTDRVMLVDERTIRLLLEDPFELKNILQKRVGCRVHLDKNTVEELHDLAGDVLMLRSADIVAYAHEEGILGKDEEYLRAALYALKYAGCAVSEREIQDYLYG